MRSLYEMWPAAFDDAEIEVIIESARRRPPAETTLFSRIDSVAHIRDCRITWLSENWVKERLWTYVRLANERAFRVDLTERSEVQFIEYESSHHYTWHHDVNWHSQAGHDRKVSVTVQLSNPGDYEGGDFEFEDVQTNADFRPKGTLIAFPSYLRHRIHPVTAGRRLALVAWFSGPQWK